MRLILSSCLLAILAFPAFCLPAVAQSVMDNLPGAPPSSPVIPPDSPDPDASPAPASPPPVAQAPAETYTVSDVPADVTADSAAHARDQALAQAQRAAWIQLCSRLNASESAAKLTDDAIAGLVASFEVQNEKLSAVRYIGVFTIRFKPLSVQRKIGKGGGGAVSGSFAGPAGPGDLPKILGPTSHLVTSVDTPSLAVWGQIKRRLTMVPQIARVDTIDLGRGVSHIDLVYNGTIDDLENAVTTQGFILRQGLSGDWDLADNSMVPR